ncbi:MAG: hypothetical protein HYV09_27800 [Deltaproteobacteria bacterium]|nr:hypothetical protein [Deltaproteobacteria bacterium]
MKREKKLTKKERQAITGKGPAGGRAAAGGQHIHCVACGRHLDPHEFDPPASATFVQCAHGSQFAACLGCQIPAQKLLDEHDRTGQPVKSASAWH